MSAKENAATVSPVTVVGKLLTLSKTNLNRISAFLVQDDAFAHYFKLHVLLTEHSSLKARIFNEREAAANWLNVPIERLEIP